MTEDEAFIRAIVDSPGDDTPRLVYADWLDDRDDPRGAYLRAEAEALRQFRETADFRPLMMWHATYPTLAATLDPLWLARVSRPPVGVCIEHVELTHRGPPVSEVEITEAEHRLGASFPADYRGFLLNFNGGWIDATTYFETPEGELIRTPDGEPVALHECGWRFDPLSEVGERTSKWIDYFRRNPPPDDVAGWFRQFAFVGCDPDMIGSIVLDGQDRHRGQVRVMDTSVDPDSIYHGLRRDPRPDYPSFAEFLSVLPRPRHGQS